MPPTSLISAPASAPCPFFLADLLRQAVAARLQLLGAGLQALALGLEGGEAVDIEKWLRLLARLETGDDGARSLRRRVMSSMAATAGSASEGERVRIVGSAPAGRVAGGSAPGRLRPQSAWCMRSSACSGRGRAGVAEDARGAVGAAAALGRDAELELQAFEAHRAVGGGLADLVVGHATADADDHLGTRL